MPTSRRRSPARSANPPGYNCTAIAAGGHTSLALRKFVCEYDLAGDYNDDCRVDIKDLAILAENWMVDCYLDVSEPACVPK